MIQYYFSQAATVTAWKAPNSRLFETQSGYIYNKTYVDLAKNYTANLSQFFRDYYSVRHWFVEGQSDYIAYYKGFRNWLENELSFVEVDAFKKAKLDVNKLLFRISSLTTKLWATPKQSSKLPTHKS
jgi:hypothetical protein